MFNPNWLPPEEKRLYDDAIYDAIIAPDGECRPTRDAGERLYERLSRLAPSYSWAEDMLSQAACQSLGKRAKAWAASQCFIDTPMGQRMVSKSAYVATKRRLESGTLVDQLQLWESLTADQLRAVIARDSKMRDALGVNVATAVALLKLCEKHGVESVPEALAAEGVSLQQFLDGRAAS